jgi:hypothetical protein
MCLYRVFQFFREMAESGVPGGGATLTTEEESVKAAGRFRTALPQVGLKICVTALAPSTIL